MKKMTIVNKVRASLFFLDQKIREDISSIIHTILTSEYWLLAKTYGKERKLNVVVLTISFVAIIFLFSIFGKLFIVSTPKTEINIVTSDDDIEIENTFFRFVNLRNEDDILEVFISVKSKRGNLEDEWLMFNASPNIKAIDHESFNANDYSVEKPWRVKDEYFDAVKHLFTFKNTESALIHEEFRGDFFGNSRTELFFDFYLSAYYGEEVPVTVTVNVLENSNLGDVSPTPTKQEGEFLVYQFDSFKNGNIYSSPVIDIRLSAIDKVAIYSNQFQLFLLGSLFAILTSAIVNIFTDFTSYASPQQLLVSQKKSTKSDVNLRDKDELKYKNMKEDNTAWRFIYIFGLAVILLLQFIIIFLFNPKKKKKLKRT